MLIKEKVEQAKKLLKEFDVDCWITFVRESQINGDPTLAFLSPADVTNMALGFHNFKRW